MKDEEEIPTTNSNDIEGLINRFEGDQMREGDKAMIARLLKMWLVMLRLMDKPKTTKVTQTLSRYISDRKLITEITYGRFHRSPKAGGRPTKQPVPPALGDFLV